MNGLRSHIKNSKECFIRYPNTSKSGKKTPLRLVFSNYLRAEVGVYLISLINSYRTKVRYAENTRSIVREFFLSSQVLFELNSAKVVLEPGVTTLTFC